MVIVRIYERKNPTLTLSKLGWERGAADRTRTGTDFTPRDFKSLVSTYSTTAAYYFIPSPSRSLGRVGWCLPIPPVAVPGARLAHGGAALLLPPVWGARYLPCRRCGCVSYRPRHTLMLRFICHWQRGATWPRPLARVAASAPGGASLAPRSALYRNA